MSDSEKDEQPVAKKRGRPSTVSWRCFFYIKKNIKIEYLYPNLGW